MRPWRALLLVAAVRGDALLEPPAAEHKCPGPYDSCTHQRCCGGGIDPVTKTPVFVCSTLTVPSMNYRCYRFKDINQVGSGNFPASTEIKARLKSEISSLMEADELCAAARPCPAGAYAHRLRLARSRRRVSSSGDGLNCLNWLSLAQITRGVRKSPR